MIAPAASKHERRDPERGAARRAAKRAVRTPQQVEDRARELMTMAAHDLRSPLASIKFRAHHIVERWRAGERPASDEWGAVVVGICRAADDAFSMIDDLLAIERLARRDPRAPAPPIVDVGAIIEKAIECERLALERARCKVMVVRQKGLTSVRGPWDRVYLLRIFGNLLRNAANHAPGAPIVVTLARRGDRLGIIFADHGPGLDGPRRRRECGGDAVDRAPTDAEVHGLGLWIVRRGVQRLDGRLRIHNRPGQGLTFDIELPGFEGHQRNSARA
jgi:signal transduction histidine kinase